MTQIDNGTIRYQDELIRKLIHLTSLSIPIVYYYISTETAALILGIIAGLALILPPFSADCLKFHLRSARCDNFVGVQ